MRRALALSLLVPLLWLTALDARADILVIYQAEDRPDVDPGKDLWRYTYLVSGRAFAQSEGFTLYFEPNLASELTLESYPMEWLAEAFQPDRPLLLPGALSAQTTQDLATGSWQFSVGFVRLGDALPGSQRYELFDADFNVLDPPGTLGTVAQVIPEPQTGALLMAGLLLLSILSMRRRVRGSGWWG